MASDLMNLSQLLNKFTSLFYVIGQSSCTQSRKHPTRWHSSSQYIIEVINKTIAVLSRCIILFTISITCYIHFIFGKGTDSSIMFISHIFLASIILTNVTPFLQNYLYSNELTRVIKTFYEIEKIFGKQLGRAISFIEFNTVYQRKLYIFGIVFVVPQLSLIWFERINLSVIDFENYIQISVFLTSFVCMHAMFYVDLEVYFLNKFTNIFDVGLLSAVSRVETPHLHRISISFKWYKCIHYKLWKNSKLIEIYFGWSLTFLMMQNFVNVTKDMYFMYVYGNEGADLLKLSRMYSNKKRRKVLAIC